MVLYRWIAGVSVLAAVTAALISGCGGGDEASAEVTKAQFTKEAEAVCADRGKKWDAAVAAFQKETEANQGSGNVAEERERSEAFFSDSILPLLKAEVEALEDLEVPEADEAKVEKMLQSRSRGLETLEENGVEALLNSPFEDFEKEASAYGLDCSMG